MLDWSNEEELDWSLKHSLIHNYIRPGAKGLLGARPIPLSSDNQLRAGKIIQNIIRPIFVFFLSSDVGNCISGLSIFKNVSEEAPQHPMVVPPIFSNDVKCITTQIGIYNKY